MKVLAEYGVSSEGVPGEIAIVRDEQDFVDRYELHHTKLKPATTAALSFLKEKIIEGVNIKISEMLDPREGENIRKRIVKKARELVRLDLAGLSEEEENIIVGRLAQEMMGLGELELVLADENLEEVVINSAKEPVWVYHKKFGWLKTNLVIPNEETIHNYSSIIGRKVGRQITNLDPLMDAHLLSGDRVNATLYPISTKGNSITIRKFARDPWTVISLIQNKTISSEAASLVWLAMQYELSVLIGGGTASGKCVSGDTNVWISGKGYAPIKEIVDAELASTNFVQETDDGFFTTPSNPIEIETMEPTTLKTTTSFISRVWKRKAPQKMISVKTASGREIKTTPEHPFFVSDGELKKVRADELKAGDLIAGPKKLLAKAENPVMQNAGKQIQLLQQKNEENSVSFFEVLEAKEVASQKEWVYDLTVEGTHNFVANGLFAHNTSFLNSILVFTPPNQRVVSIEDTRELLLPDFLHWTPMTTRQSNPEGKGRITMLDLMVNSLRMRPDRIVLGEIRRQREAEVLFEAMHTGHSVYSTLHADDASQVRNRLINPPIGLPESVLGALHLVVVQYRQRRTGARRSFEIAEVMPNDEEVTMNIVYKWDARDDTLRRVGDILRVTNELAMHTGMSQNDISNDLENKQTILNSMIEKGISRVNDVGKIVGSYYRTPDEVVELAKKDQLIKLLVK